MWLLWEKRDTMDPFAVFIHGLLFGEASVGSDEMQWSRFRPTPSITTSQLLLPNSCKFASICEFDDVQPFLVDGNQTVWPRAPAPAWNWRDPSVR